MQPPKIDAPKSNSGPSLPAPSLPKGGGALAPLGEKRIAHPQTGTSGFSIPIATSPGRSGFGPSLSLTYDSGAGQGVFGLGWSVSVSSISRKTDKGLPRYGDDDIFVADGAEDLVEVGVDGDVTRYRPRVDNAYSRIELHRRTDDAPYWVVYSRTNVRSVYGFSSAARLADPAEPRRVFRWLLEWSDDDRGNVIAYFYKPENDGNVQPSSFEAGRARTNLYLKAIGYGLPTMRGNRQAAPSIEMATYPLLVLFDYGDHSEQDPRLDDDLVWPARPDPFSVYRSGFEVRTHRLCQRVLMLHRFDAANPRHAVVRSLELHYAPDPAGCRLESVHSRGWKLDSETKTYSRLAGPVVQLGYTSSDLQPHSVSLDGALPLDSNSRLVDLDGEGLPGFVREVEGAWFYARPLGAGRWSTPISVDARPNVSLRNGWQVVDQDGDGRAEVVQLAPPIAGAYDEGVFHPFDRMPTINWDDPELRFVDLDGDGLPDVLIHAGGVLRWHRSHGLEGYGPEQRTPLSTDVPLFSNATSAVSLADMTGDGLADIVVVEASGVSYWPNLGHGRFGRRVRMGNAPLLASRESFAPERVLLADIDGTGPADLSYFTSDGLVVVRNLSGNSFAAPRTVPMPLRPGAGTRASILDLFGRGTATVLLAGALPSGPLVAAVNLLEAKPNLLRTIDNGCGALTTIEYEASTSYYLADRNAGRPWITTLPFPVHVVDRVIVEDRVAETKQIVRYRYHHGFYDGVEREFRGFALVEEEDSEVVVSLPDKGDAPRLTKTFYHTGALLDRERISRQLVAEYFAAPGLPALPESPLPPDLLPQEARDALRALRGSPLRVEVFALDGNPTPYSITETNYTLRREQPAQGKHRAVFASHPRETLTVHTERHIDDPRIAHEVVVKVGAFGDVESQVSITYPRRAAAGRRKQQERGWAKHNAASFAHLPSATDAYRVGIPTNVRTYELIGLDLDDLQTFETIALAAATPEHGWANPAARVDAGRWLIEHSKVRYWNSALTAELEDDDVDVRALVCRTLTLSTTRQTITDAWAGRASGVESLAVAEGGYLVEGDLFWSFAGRLHYDEHAFYLPWKLIDPWGAESEVHYEEPHLLLPDWSRDAVANRTEFENDYRLLAPVASTDQNGTTNRIEADALGIVRKSWVVGAAGEGGQTTDIGYSFYVDPTHPAHVHIKTARDFGGEWQEAWLYSDGSGREIQTKLRVEPNADFNPCFVGTGRTVFNHKGLPVKQYEPYFSGISDFDVDTALVTRGVTPLLHYDPVGRVVRTDLPDKTYTQVLFAAWSTEQWDAVDTLTTDSEWYKARHQPSFPHEPALSKKAATDALKLAATPSRGHLDALGRSFASIADAGPDAVAAERYCETIQELDLEGNVWSVTDPRSIEIATHVFDIGGRQLRVSSKDAGETYTLHDALGKPLYVWRAKASDPEATRVRYEHDPARRVVGVWEKRGSDPTERLRERTIYRDGPAAGANAAGRIAAQLDGGGLVEMKYEFRGLLSETTRHVLLDKTVEADWSSSADWLPGSPIPSNIEPEALMAALEYDAASRETNRTTQVETQPASTVRRRYNRAGQLHGVDVAVRGGSKGTLIGPITYDEKGRRATATHQHGGETTYSYDKVTFRLERQTLSRNGEPVLDLLYVYDPVGNISAIRDAVQKDTYFKNAIAPPIRSYTYDGLYRLVSATGREHASQSRPDQRDVPEWLSLPYYDSNNPKQIVTYTETYDYDQGGNLRTLTHSGLTTWKREYKVAITSNQLQSTTLLGVDSMYSYDARGNMRSMAHLDEMSWSHRDELLVAKRTRIGETVLPSASNPVYFAYDAGSQRVFKHTSNTTRIYTGGFDLYRDASSGLVRETLEIHDEVGRIALIETRTDRNEVPQIRHHHNDHQGSAVLELDELGAPITYEEFHPYGTTALAVGNKPKRFRFTGQERDEETSLQYHHHRYYAPWLARWTSADPRGFVDGPNRYSYCGANPISFSDKRGTDRLDELRAHAASQPKDQSGSPISDDQLRGSWNPADERELRGKLYAKYEAHLRAEDASAKKEYELHKNEPFWVATHGLPQARFTSDGKATELGAQELLHFRITLRLRTDGILDPARRLRELYYQSWRFTSGRLEYEGMLAFAFAGIAGGVAFRLSTILTRANLAAAGKRLAALHADETGAVKLGNYWGEESIPPNELVPSLRPPSTGSGPHPFAGVPKALHGEVFDIIADLQAARQGDASAAARLGGRSPHPLTGDMKGWNSLDLAGRQNPLRFLYKEEAGGLKWMVKDTHR